VRGGGREGRGRGYGGEMAQTMYAHMNKRIKKILKKTTDKECWQECEENGILTHYYWECYLLSLYGKLYGNSSNN
jgi:hypothetical protein